MDPHAVAGVDLPGRLRWACPRGWQRPSQRGKERAGHLLRRAETSGSSLVSLGQTQAALAEELGTVRKVIARARRPIPRRRLRATPGSRGGRHGS